MARCVSSSPYFCHCYRSFHVRLCTLYCLCFFRCYLLGFSSLFIYIYIQWFRYTILYIKYLLILYHPLHFPSFSCLSSTQFLLSFSSCFLMPSFLLFPFLLHEQCSSRDNTSYSSSYETFLSFLLLFLFGPRHRCQFKKFRSFLA